jgi:hypothetical protein
MQEKSLEPDGFAAQTDCDSAMARIPGLKSRMIPNLSWACLGWTCLKFRLEHEFDVLAQTGGDRTVFFVAQVRGPP